MCFCVYQCVSEYFSMLPSFLMKHLLFFDSFTCNLLQLGFYSRLVPPSFLACFSLSKSLSCRQSSLPFLSIQIMMVCYDGLSQLSVYLPYAINLPIGTSEKRFSSLLCLRQTLTTKEHTLHFISCESLVMECPN